MIRVKTLSDIKALVDAGEFKGFELALDNDTVSIWSFDETLPDIEFSVPQDPNWIIRDALTLLGIPWTDV